MPMNLNNRSVHSVHTSPSNLVWVEPNLKHWACVHSVHTFRNLKKVKCDALGEDKETGIGLIKPLIMVNQIRKVEALLPLKIKDFHRIKNHHHETAIDFKGSSNLNKWEHCSHAKESEPLGLVL